VSTDHVLLTYVVFFITVTSSLKGPNIFLSTLLLNTLSLHSSLNGIDKVSYPYKTSKISLYTLIYIFGQQTRIQNILQ